MAVTAPARVSELENAGQCVTDFLPLIILIRQIGRHKLYFVTQRLSIAPPKEDTIDLLMRARGWSVSMCGHWSRQLSITDRKGHSERTCFICNDSQ